MDPFHAASRARGPGRWSFALGLLLAGLLVGCRVGSGPTGSSEHAGWIRWKAERLESVVGTNGWASLAGLHWLPEGPSTSGTRPGLDHEFPAGRAPAVVGVWHRREAQVRFEPAPGVMVSKNGRPFTGGVLITDAHGATPDALSVGGLRITVIDRGGRLGLRVKDPLAPTRTRFAGLRYFDWSSDWIIPARLEPASPGSTLSLANVIGGRESLPLAGTLVFERAGKTHRLLAAVDTETDDLFVLFRDTTNGGQTYGAGRFLHAPKPDAAGRTVLDFNRAYNPPCAFTPFATCPLTPPANRLSVPVRAGERRYSGGPDSRNHGP
jgi:uncharacterized protein (DUF1684 family)